MKNLSKFNQAFARGFSGFLTYSMFVQKASPLSSITYIQTADMLTIMPTLKNFSESKGATMMQTIPIRKWTDDRKIVSKKKKK